MRQFAKLIIALIALVALAVSPAMAQGKGDNHGNGKDKNTSEIADILADRTMDKSKRFVLNNTLYTLYHEVGHLLVDQLQWPVLSREEDVADNFATYFLLNQSRRSFEQALKDAALGWRLSDDAYGARRHVSEYYDEHSLDLQRAYQIVCLMVGKDRATFHVTAREWGIDRQRQARCSDDYAQIEQAFTQVINRSANKDTETKINVYYGVAGDRYNQAYKTLRESQILESVAEELRRGFGLPRPVTIRADLCNEPNAFYDYSRVEIIMCYELVDDFFDMIGKHLASGNTLK